MVGFWGVRYNANGRCNPTFNLSDSLIALGLERYYEELRKAKLDRRKRCKTRSTTVEVSLNSVCRRIETEMLCWRRILPNAVYRYVVRRRNQKDRAMNPIQVGAVLVIYGGVMRSFFKCGCLLAFCTVFL